MLSVNPFYSLRHLLIQCGPQSILQLCGPDGCIDINAVNVEVYEVVATNDTRLSATLYFCTCGNKPCARYVEYTKAANLGSFCNILPDPDAHGARRGFYFCMLLISLRTFATWYRIMTYADSVQMRRVSTVFSNSYVSLHYPLPMISSFSIQISMDRLRYLLGIRYTFSAGSVHNWSGQTLICTSISSTKNLVQSSDVPN